MLDDFFKSEALSQEASQRYSGSFQADLSGENCKLELVTKPNKVFTGILYCKGQSFDLKGKLSPSSHTYFGFLLDPTDNLPFAYLKAQMNNEILKLELSVPDFEKLFESLDAEEFIFQRRDMDRSEFFPLGPR